MAKFAKVIDVKDVKEIDQILIYVHQNDDDLYVCSIYTHLLTCEANLTLKINPQSDDDNCFDSVISLFNKISNAPDKDIISAITNLDIYQELIKEQSNG